MMSSEEMVNRLWERRDRYLAEKKAQRRTAGRITASVSAVCIVALIGIWLWQSDRLRPAPTLNEEPDSAPTGGVGETPVTDTGIVSGGGMISGDDGFTTWNGCAYVGGRLYEALTAGNADDVYDILARPAVIDCTFLYEGKTLGEYQEAWDEERHLPEKLMMLLKEGESLKYGEALYETGTPDGEKWAKSFYEDLVAFFGSAILEKYIVDGEFLAEEVERDISAAQNSTRAAEAYQTAFAAWLEWLASSVSGQLPSEAVPERSCILLHMTRDEFSAFVSDNGDGIDTTGWLFDLAIPFAGDEGASDRVVND